MLRMKPALRTSQTQRIVGQQTLASGLGHQSELRAGGCQGWKGVSQSPVDCLSMNTTATEAETEQSEQKEQHAAGFRNDEDRAIGGKEAGVPEES